MSFPHSDAHRSSSPPPMAAKLLPLAAAALFLATFLGAAADSLHQVQDSSLQLPLEWAMQDDMMYSFGGEDDEVGEDDGDGEDGRMSRRSLYWRLTHYYISYGALSANRIPCPPRSGRSYYTHNCYRARGPVHPYHRGCSRITMCRSGFY